MILRHLAVVLVVAAWALPALAEYKDTPHRTPAGGEIAVSKPGSYDQAGKTYVLTADVAGDMTPIFLGNNVTLDLNGHTVTFAAAKYEHVPNSGFEDGTKDWDMSKAPGAKIVPTTVRSLIGKKFLELKRGEEIVSQYINLPVAERSYYAMCAVGAKDMRVTINVEDADGKPVRCEFKGGQKPEVTVPEIGRHTELGGGVVFAHMHYLPAGKYRLRIKAETDCQIDECDIRPGLDAGVAIVEHVSPWASYDAMLRYHPCAFFDYCKKDSRGVPVDAIPIVKGAGTVTIKNGVIRNGTPGMRTLGVQSNAPEVTVVLENLKILNSGTNTNAARLVKATLKDCRFEIDTPFCMNRHDTSEMSVRVERATEIAHCEFIGGQGNFSGACPDIHDNLFVNGETVTNHYSIGPGSGTKIYRNRFEPKIGSGIYIGAGTGVEVYDNVFKIETAPPNCEYREHYSTSAIRLSDYDTKPDAPAARRCAGNKVYRNKIAVTARAYPDYEGYVASGYAFFISVGGGTNYIYDNEITIDRKDAKGCLGLAFFVGGSSNGGEIYNNKVTTNCPVAWVGNEYGNAANTLFYGNTFTKAPGTAAGVRPFVLGAGGNTSNALGFFSNNFAGWGADWFEVHTNSVSYAVGWTATVKVLDAAGKPAVGAEVVITNQDGAEAARGKTDAQGQFTARLPQYRHKNGQQTDCSTYTAASGAAKATLEMKKDQIVTLR